MQSIVSTNTVTHQINLVTSNARKIYETKQFLKEIDPSIEIVAHHLELDEIQSLDQSAVAIDKAQRAWDIIQKPLLVDDCGIYFEGYNRFPGTFTKFCYDAIGLEGLQRLIEKDGLKAYLQMTLVYIDGPDSYQIFQTQCHGKLSYPKADITEKAWGHTCFYPAGSALSFFELYDLPEFYYYSHRREALEQFATWFFQNTATRRQNHQQPKEQTL